MAFHLIDMNTWERREHYQYYQTREFDTSLIKKVPQSLIIGLFFCQLFYFTI